MEKNLLNNYSIEKSIRATNETVVLPRVNDVEEIVIYDECGDTMWDKVLAQDAVVNTLKQHLME